VNELGARLSLAWAVPMAGVLLSIAIFPLVAKHVWERWYGRIGLLWALAFILPAGFQWGFATMSHEVLHVLLLDYVPFVLLVGALFVISGGILISGPFRGTPRSNASLLLAGTACASLLGTTGASMLFIRPLLRANRHRRHRVHTMVFFLFLVSNVGGSLTPLGDPPLFLGYLRGVPFFWTTTNLLAPTLFLTGLLTALYVAIDVRLLARERAAGHAHEPTGPVPIRIDGAFNLILLLLVAGVILLSGAFAKHSAFQNADGSSLSVPIAGVRVPVLSLASDLLLLVLIVVSLKRTPKTIREKNEFLWGPLEEVAILFLSIFITIVPVLLMLKAGESGAFRPLIETVRSPAHYFWMTGILSSFLDNAPSYVVFFETAHATPMPEFAARGPWGAADPVDPELVDMPSLILTAISSGAVFMGAMTYIGNGPNFMVRSIAERAGVKMPSFFGYMLKWSLPILLPAFGLLTLLFFV
jgi:Na+/H+ antiporter NhaD/arsenite permease-like protein